MHFDLSPLATRVLGSLMEKERTTPEHYPLTLNSLVAAVNQSTNRDPVMSAETAEVEQALEELREEKLIIRVMTPGARVGKYQHRLWQHYDLETPEASLLCVLMLRGPQTAGELKSRTERMHPFDSLAEVEETLLKLGNFHEGALARKLPPRPGRKGTRWVQLLTAEPDQDQDQEAEITTPGEEEPRRPTRMERLQEKVDSLEKDLADLREEFTAFKRQFESDS